MTSEIQSYLAILVVFVTTAVFVYLRFIKKQNGCGSDCGCSNIPKKFPGSPKSIDPKD